MGMSKMVMEKDKKTYQAPMNRYQSGRFKFNLDDDDEDEDENATLSNIGPASRFKVQPEVVETPEFVVSKTTNCTLRMRNTEDMLIKISFDCEPGDTASKIIGEMADEGLISKTDQASYEKSLNDYLSSGGTTQVFKVKNLNGRGESEIDMQTCIGYSKFTS